MDSSVPADLRDILPEPIEDALELFPFGPGGAGGSPAARPPALLPYRAFEWKGARFAWTEHPDGLGRHRALMIRTTLEGWRVVADEGFPSAEAAKAWAARRWAEARGLGVDEGP